MSGTQAATTDDRIRQLTETVAKLAQKVDNMVSHRTMRADSARDDAEEKRDDAARRDEEEDEKAKKDAARDTLFGKKDAKRDDESEEEEEKEEKKDAKSDESEEEEEKEEEKEEKKDNTDPEPMASDDKRRDAKRDDEKRDDARRDDKRDDDRRDRADARADSATIRGLTEKISRLERAMQRPKAMTDDELNALAERQQDWDRVAQMHGLRASRPLDGERIESYDRRLAKVFQKHSPKWKDTDLSVLPVELVTSIIAPEIRADSVSAAYRVEPDHNGRLREVRKTDRAGRVISEFVGPVDAVNGALAPFSMPSARVRRINTQPNQY